MDFDQRTIGESKKMAKLFSGGGDTQLFPNGHLCIAVLQRGHIVTGVYSQNGEIGTISNAAVVRRWGTTKGLGELAQNGPMEETILDPCPTVSFHIREAVLIMECNKNAWGK